MLKLKLHYIKVKSKREEKEKADVNMISITSHDLRHSAISNRILMTLRRKCLHFSYASLNFCGSFMKKTTIFQLHLF